MKLFNINQFRLFFTNSYLIDIVFATLILLLPFLLYSYLFFENISLSQLFFGLINQSEKPVDDIFVWHILLRFIPLVCFCIWFITSIYNWRYLIFIPIAMFGDTLIRDSLSPLIISDFNDLELLMTSIFIIVFLIFLLLIIRNKIASFFEKPNELSMTKILRNDARNLYLGIKVWLNNIKFKNTRSQFDYLLELAYMDNFLTQKRSNFLNPHKTKTHSNSTKIIVLIFLFLPFIFYFHLIVPDQLQSFNLGFFTITSFGFPSIDILIWLLLLKVTYLVCLSIWFITSIYWWKYAILSPIVLVSYQIWEMFQNVQNIDSWGNFRALPFIVLITMTILILSRYIKYEFKVANLHDFVIKELDEMIRKKADLEQIERFRLQLEKLKSMGSTSQIQSAQNLTILLQIRDYLMNDLDIKN